MPQQEEWTDEQIEQAMYEAEGQQEGDSGSSEEAEPQRQERQPFRFSDELQEPERDDTGSQEGSEGQGQGQDNLVKIVHRGNVHWVTPEKAQELAQKGFDYDTKVGPHARIAQLIQSDPELAGMVDQHVRRKLGQEPAQQGGQQQSQGQQGQQPAQDPLQSIEWDPPDKFNDDNEWLKANVQKALNAQAQQFQQQLQQYGQQTQKPQQGQMSPAQQLLLSHDPQGFSQVAPKLKDYAQRHLTVQQYQRVNQDPQALMEFYDWVRSQEIGDGGVPQGGQQQQRKKQAPFRAQSGGGQPRRGKSEEERIWDMPNEEFEKEMQKLKGFG